MNLNLRLGRGSFHPAWLLLLLPPLLWPQDDSLIGIPWVLQFIGVIPILLILVPITGLARRQVTSLSLRLGKEFRAQMPGALLAIVAPSLLMMSGDRDGAHQLATTAYVLGCAVLGATAFGAEFDQRTMGSLLTQPLRRGTLFADKLLVLGLLLAVAASQYFLCDEVWVHHEPRVWVEGMEATLAALISFAGPPLIAFCTGPLLSLRTRNTLAGAVFTIAMPLVLILTGQVILGQTWKWRHPHEELAEFAPHLEAWCWTVLPLYALVSTWLGWFTFKTLELPGEERSGGEAHAVAVLMDRGLKAVWPHGGANGNAMLLRKELRLQVVPWLVSLLLLVSWALLWACRPDDTDPANPQRGSMISELTLSLAFIFGGMNLLFIGSACIAEERQLGTLDWQLTCPATVRRQWWVKAGVAMVLSLLLGLALPTAMVFSMSGHARWAEMVPGEPWQILVQVEVGLLVAALAIYGSSLSRNSIKAACTTMGVGAAVVVLCFAATRLVFDGFQGSQAELIRAWETDSLPPVTWPMDPDTVQSVGHLAATLTPILAIAMILSVSALNFRRGIPAGSALIWQWTKLTAGLVTLYTAVMTAMGFLLLEASHRNLAKTPHPRSRPQPAVRPPSAASRPPGVNLSPEMASRYGLGTAAGASANGASLSGRTNTGVERYLREGALGKRYGLVIRPAPSTNPPAPSK
jgi:ABC-type transport system involved in multi-copper enzyme maturation permease subunit